MGKYIISDPEIMSGMPVIKGTRVPIARILFLLKIGYTIDKIHEDFPHVSKKTIEKTIDELIDLLAKNDYGSEIL